MVSLDFIYIEGLLNFFCYFVVKFVRILFYNINLEGKVFKMIKEYGEGFLDVGGIYISCVRKVVGIFVFICLKVYKVLGGYWFFGCKL